MAARAEPDRMITVRTKTPKQRVERPCIVGRGCEQQRRDCKMAARGEQSRAREARRKQALSSRATKRKNGLRKAVKGAE